MSVYHQARLDGRLTDEGVSSAGGSPRRALQTVKRAEAERRNARTPRRHTKAYRREVGARLGFLGVTVYGRKRNQPPVYPEYLPGARLWP